MLGHFKKSTSILTDQETQMVGNDWWPVMICNTAENAILQNKIVRSKKVSTKWKIICTEYIQFLKQISKLLIHLYLLSLMAGVNKTTICCNRMSYFNIFGVNKEKICSIFTKFVQCKILKILMIKILLISDNNNTKTEVYIEQLSDYRLRVIIGLSRLACFSHFANSNIYSIWLKYLIQLTYGKFTGGKHFSKWMLPQDSL